MSKKTTQFTQFIIHYYKGAYKEQFPTMTDKEFFEMIENIILETIKSSDDIAFYKYILHDSDIDKEKNTEKPAHVHLLILLKSGVKRTINSMAKRFKTTQSSNVMECKDFFGTCRYFLHITDQAIYDKKHIYDFSKLHYGFLAPRTVENRPIRDIWDCLLPMERDKENDRKQQKAEFEDYLLSLIENGEITTVEALQRFDNEGLKFTRSEKIRFKNKTDKMVDIYMKNRLHDMKVNGRNLNTILISCDDVDSTGSGKTKIGTSILNKLYDGNYFKATSPDKKKTPDLIQGYKMEKGLLVDEFRGGEFNVDAFKSSFDPKHYGNISSRNSNVAFVGETVIFTSSYSISDIVFNTMRFSEGGSRYFEIDCTKYTPTPNYFTEEYYKDALQLCRRIPIYIKLSKQNGDLKLLIYRWDNRKKNDYYMNQGYGLIAEKFIKNYNPDDQKQIDFIADLIIKEIENPTIIKYISPMKYINKHYRKLSDGDQERPDINGIFKDAFDKEIEIFDEYSEISETLFK